MKLLLRLDEALLPGSGLDLENAIELLEECREEIANNSLLKGVKWELREAESNLLQAENEIYGLNSENRSLERKVARVEAQLEELLQKMRGQA